MTAKWFTALGVSLLMTLVLETGAALAAGKRRGAVRLVVLANLLTNPPVVLCVLLWRNAALPLETLLTAGLELLAVAAEAMVYSAWRKEFPHPWRFSLLLNLFSFGTGLLLRLLI